jgi:signal transduction histidine kinase
MKVQAWFVLFLLIFSFSCTRIPAFAQPLPNSIAGQRAYIDHINGVVYDIYLKSPDSARNMAEQMLLLSEKIKYPVGISRSYHNIGVIYWSQSYYPIALYYLNAALANTTKDQRLLLSEIYSDIGRVYADLLDYKRALYNLNKCELYAGKDALHLGEAISEQSYVYMKLHNYPKAISLATLALNYDHKIKEEMGAAILYSRLGTLYYEKHDHERAKAYDDTAYRESVRLQMHRLTAGMYGEYAMMDNHAHRYGDAIALSKKSIALFDSLGVFSGQVAGYKILIQSYEGKKDLAKALATERKYNKIQDSLNTIDKVKSAQLIQNYFELNSRLNELAQADKKNQNNRALISFQHTVINILVVSLVLVLLLLTVTYYFYNQKKLLNSKLQAQHNKLSAQKKLIESQAGNLKEVNGMKDKMLAVIAHDLRSPIANLLNILSMFEQDYLTPEEVHVLMQDINPIVKSTDLTLTNLLEWAGSQIKGGAAKAVEIDVFLLGVEMEQTFKHLLKTKELEFINLAKPAQMVMADLNHIRIILRNLISNAIKFTGDKGSISLHTKVDGDKLAISVTDTGTGMSAQDMDSLFNLDTHFSNSGTSGEKGTGLGLILCKELTELNGSKLLVQSKLNEGTTFTFKLPLAR